MDSTGHDVHDNLVSPKEQYDNLDTAKPNQKVTQELQEMHERAKQADMQVEMTTDTMLSQDILSPLNDNGFRGEEDLELSETG